MVRIGIIGLGFMGRTHWGFLKDIKNARLVAGADIDLARVKKDMAVGTGNIDTGGTALSLDDLTVYESGDELIADPDVDVVDICVPPWSHTEFVIKALAAGKHVFCEKPMADTLASAAKAVKAAEASDQSVMYGHCIRFWPEYVKTKELLEDGAIGRVVHAHLYRMSPIPGWGWFLDRDNLARVGGVLDLHIHDADFAMYMWGTPSSVSATGGSLDGGPLDSINAIYRFPDGPAVSIFGCWGFAPTVPFDMGFDIVGEKGTIRFRMANKPSLVVHRFKGKDITPKIPAGNGWIEELKYFVNCVRDGRKPENATAQDAYDALRLSYAAVKAAKTGKPVTIAE